MNNIQMNALRRSSGFTLLELIITMAIIGILSSIAYPSYLDSLQRSRAADVQGVLVSFANAMEKHYVRQNTFLGAGQTAGNTGLPITTLFPSQAPLDGNDKYYNLTIQPLGITANTYTLRATPINSQVGMGYMELLSTGARRWDRNNNNAIASTTLENSWD